MIYQQIIKHLNEIRNSGIDIGNSVLYLNDNIFDLVDLYENKSSSIHDLVNICMDNK